MTTNPYKIHSILSRQIRRAGRIILTLVMAIAIVGSGMAAPPKKGSTGKTTEKSASAKKSGGTAKKKSTGSSSGKTGGTSSGKSSGKGSKGSTKGKKSNTRKSSGKNSGKQQGGRKETSADVKRRQEATQQEIRKTKAEIAENEKAVAVGISNLRKLEGDIEVSRKEIGHITGEVKTLSTNITGLEKNIGAEEKRLDKLRKDYMSAVKKMRVARKSNSALAFVFASKSFSEAMRRMRYLKDFSAWKDKQTQEITRTVGSLKKERQMLAGAKADRDAALRRQVEARNRLEQQHAQQDALVVDLRRNGEALNSHLAKKQAEANQLRNQVSALIAQEEARRQEAQRQAELREQQRREAEAKAEAQRQEAIRQREIAEAREREKTEAEAKAKAAEESKTEKDKKSASKSEVSKKETSKKEASKKETSKKETAKKETTKKESGKKKDKSYADARKRRPRSQSSGNTKTEASKPTSPAQTPAKTPTKPSVVAGGNGFESMKGSLPRPVAGAFRVVSPFGRQTLPELPDVVYDNPGIDAEVAKGAVVQAVYGGTVSAVYVVPGFSTVVIVNHGNYYTVYGNIASPAVKVGDSVKQGGALGKLAVDADDPSHSTIHFEVWKKREKQNPMSWIR